MRRSTHPRRFLTAEEDAQVRAAIADAERTTSAEIKVAMVRHCWLSLTAKAQMLFERLGLEDTEQRNCVMILLVVTNREFLIYGDQGIHEKVGQAFWDDVRDVMAEKFHQDAFADGLCEGVRRAGEKLAEFFPWEEGDRNEISDEILYEG